jgi:hypothetical protein
MITVRFASGFSVQYNTANFVTRHTEYSDLSTAKDGTWVAQVPNSALIEVVTPCRVYSAVRDETTETIRGLMEAKFKTFQRQIRNLKKKNQ